MLRINKYEGILKKQSVIKYILKNMFRIMK